MSPVTTQRSRSQTQAQLSLHVIVVGGGVTGLGTALALTRVGHRVTVLEQDPEDRCGRSHGITLPPNQSKILARWGLKEACDKITIPSRALHMYKYADGDFLGKQDWDAAILHECGGEWLVARHSDVRDAVLSAARANGATVRFNARVVSFDESRAQVTLENGEVISADVVVGADGINSAMRSSIFEDEEDIIETDQVMFSTMIPVEKMRADPETAHISIDGTITCWYGDLHCAIGYAAGSTGEYTLELYAPRPTDDPNASGPPSSGSYETSVETMISCLGPTCDPRIRSMMAMALPPTCISIRSHPALDEDDWILPSSRGIVIGDAAHPAPPGQIQSSAMAYEDAAVLAKLFSHLRRKDQIPGLLDAFVSLRSDRALRVLQAETDNIQFMTLPYSNPGAQMRDDMMQDMTRRGKNIFGGPDELASAESGRAIWENFCSVWTYDAEDEADNWWVEWGALGERAHGQENPQAVSVDFGGSIIDVQIELGKSNLLPY